MQRRLRRGLGLFRFMLRAWWIDLESPRRGTRAMRLGGAGSRMQNGSGGSAKVDGWGYFDCGRAGFGFSRGAGSGGDVGWVSDCGEPVGGGDEYFGRVVCGEAVGG